MVSLPARSKAKDATGGIKVCSAGESIASVHSSDRGCVSADAHAETPSAAVGGPVGGGAPIQRRAFELGTEARRKQAVRWRLPSARKPAPRGAPIASDGGGEGAIETHTSRLARRKQLVRIVLDRAGGDEVVYSE